MTKKQIQLMQDCPAGFLKLPKGLSKIPIMRATNKFIAPTVVNSMGLCTITENQGATSKCAAYSTTSWAENILWKQDNYPTQLDYDKVYARAKEIDGDETDGTTLPAAMQALLDVYPKLFDQECKPKMIRAFGGNLDDLRYAIHKYGCVVGGFMITEDWYKCDNKCKGWIPVTKGAKPLGGHAVLICGYNQNGLQIQNSWGAKWGENGFATLDWNAAKDQFLYGEVLKGCMKHIDD
jgi:hypothetical protein